MACVPCHFLGVSGSPWPQCHLCPLPSAHCPQPWSLVCSPPMPHHPQAQLHLCPLPSAHRPRPWSLVCSLLVHPPPLVPVPSVPTALSPLSLALVPSVPTALSLVGDRLDWARLQLQEDARLISELASQLEFVLSLIHTEIKLCLVGLRFPWQGTVASGTPAISPSTQSRTSIPHSQSWACWPGGPWGGAACRLEGKPSECPLLCMGRSKCLGARPGG